VNRAKTVQSLAASGSLWGESATIRAVVTLLFCAVCASGCKIEIPVPAGGQVVTQSGSLVCPEQTTCVVDVRDTEFQEVFVAQADTGYTFSGWKRRQRGLFGGRTSPEIEIDTSGFTGNDVLLTVLRSDEVFYLEPVFDRLSAAGEGSPSAPYLADEADAVRFLYQSTFGIRDGDLEKLLDLGAQRWFSWQLNMAPRTYTSAWSRIADELGDIDGSRDANGVELTHEAFMMNALESPDQLRQRMTYALSQLFVISDRFDFGHHDQLVLGYADTLHVNAFGNFRDLLRSVTLHPAMGMYLAMLGNQKADPVRNIRPDENFARELMQLFTIGLQELNQDGTPILDANGRPKQTYTQIDVQNYAAALTGWYFAGVEPIQFGDTFHSVDHDLRVLPMVPYEQYHQKTRKNLLNGVVVPAGATAEESLEAVLDSLFYHPNVAPFVSRHLIRNFVTSNPSPAYVARVSAVFDSDENDERGNLASVLRAVLFDPEARLPLQDQEDTYGRVKDPLLRWTNVARFFDLQGYLDSKEFLRDKPSQTFLGAPSVFNFYSPDHTPNEVFAERGMVAPELQVFTADSIVKDAGMYAYISTRANVEAYRDLSDTEALQWTLVNDYSRLIREYERGGIRQLIDYLNKYLAQGRLDDAFIDTLLQTYEEDIDWFWQRTNVSELKRTADIHNLFTRLIFQIVISPEFIVQR
jgi:uncharacterized protein (DUF1800 family)